MKVFKTQRPQQILVRWIWKNSNHLKLESKQLQPKGQSPNWKSQQPLKMEIAWRQKHIQKCIYSNKRKEAADTITSRRVSREKTLFTQIRHRPPEVSLELRSSYLAGKLTILSDFEVQSFRAWEIIKQRLSNCGWDDHSSAKGVGSNFNTSL